MKFLIWSSLWRRGRH